MAGFKDLFETDPDKVKEAAIYFADQVYKLADKVDEWGHKVAEKVAVAVYDVLDVSHKPKDNDS